MRYGCATGVGGVRCWPWTCGTVLRYGCATGGGGVRCWPWNCCTVMQYGGATAGGGVRCWLSTCGTVMQYGCVTVKVLCAAATILQHAVCCLVAVLRRNRSKCGLMCVLGYREAGAHVRKEFACEESVARQLGCEDHQFLGMQHGRAGKKAGEGWNLLGLLDCRTSSAATVLLFRYRPAGWAFCSSRRPGGRSSQVTRGPGGRSFLCTAEAWSTFLA
eukprot:351528-Chlamydomonas_euryale.AAC.5